MTVHKRAMGKMLLFKSITVKVFIQQYKSMYLKFYQKAKPIFGVLSNELIGL